MQMRKNMDEYFTSFLNDFGPAICTQKVPASSIERYRGKLPDQLLSYWQEYGWSGYAAGLFWTINPEEYEPVLEAWIGETPFMENDAYHIIARSAFGDLFVFGEQDDKQLHIIAPDSQMMPPREVVTTDLNLSIRAFFGTMSPDACDFSDVNGNQLFESTLKKLGMLKEDEMYGFVPALALGGPATLGHLQKVKAVEHLVFLAQLAPLTIMSY